MNIKIMEIWKEIKGYEGLYCVSNLGSICRIGRTIKHKQATGSEYSRSVKEIILKPHITVLGYKTVRLCKGGVCKPHFIHRLVADAFIPKVENKPYINHKNSIKLDNYMGNLEWCTPRENQIHKVNALYPQKLVGTRKSGKKFFATINIDGKHSYLGMFGTEIEAHNAYCRRREMLPFAQK